MFYLTKNPFHKTASSRYNNGFPSGDLRKYEIQPECNIFKDDTIVGGVKHTKKAPKYAFNNLQNIPIITPKKKVVRKKKHKCTC